MRLAILCAIVMQVPEWKCFPDGACVLNGFSLRWSGAPDVVVEEDEPNKWDYRELKDVDDY